LDESRDPVSGIFRETNELPQARERFLGVYVLGENALPDEVVRFTGVIPNGRHIPSRRFAFRAVHLADEPNVLRKQEPVANSRSERLVHDFKAGVGQSLFDWLWVGNRNNRASPSR
jgi:hypothetical protein